MWLQIHPLGTLFKVTIFVPALHASLSAASGRSTAATYSSSLNAIIFIRNAGWMLFMYRTSQSEIVIMQYSVLWDTFFPLQGPQKEEKRKWADT